VTRLWRGAIITSVVVLAQLVVPSFAWAATTCTFTAFDAKLTIVIGSGESVSVGNAGGAFAVTEETAGAIPCGIAATTSSVDLIAITGSTGAESLLIDDLATMGPGATNEGFMSEIEMTVNLGGGSDDVTFSGFLGIIRLGTDGINYMPDHDADISPLVGVESVLVQGSPADETIGANGASVHPSFGTLLDDPYPVAVTIDGRDGSDFLVGGDGDDVITAGVGATETLLGGLGNDQISGGPANSTIDGEDGDDEMDGGEGTDTLSYGSHATPVIASFDGIENDGSPGESDVISDFENLSGGSGNDNLTGDGGPNVLSGDNGADTLSGLGDDDELHGNAGADIQLGGDNDDTFLEADDNLSNDTIDGGNGRDHVSYAGRGQNLRVDLLEDQNDGAIGSGENDNVMGNVEDVSTSNGNDILVGTSSDNRFDSFAGIDSLTGGLGNDELISGAGIDTLVGEAGDDRLAGGDDIDDLNGGDDHDVLDGGADADILTAGTGNDQLSGGTGDDSDLFGGLGDDTFLEPYVGGFPETHNGSDVFTGDAGKDTVIYTGRTIPLSFSWDEVANDGAQYTFTAVEEDDNIKDDIEVVFGGSSADSFLQEATPQGAQEMHGGGGIDMVFYELRTASIRAAMDGVADDGQVGEGDNLATDIEGIETGPGNDVIIGSDAGNIFHAGDGNDDISGGGGDDTVWESLEPGAFGHIFNTGSTTPNGSDTISGGAGKDGINYVMRDSGVNITVDSGANDDGQPGEADDVDGFEDLTGTVHNDLLQGTGADDHLQGIAGDNELRGMGGADFIETSSGSNDFYGGPGDDYMQVYCCSPQDNVFHEDAVANGSDTMVAGGNSTVDYSQRTADITVVVQNAGGGDTGAGESDFVYARNVKTGSGNDDVSVPGTCSDDGSPMHTYQLGAGDDSLVLGTCNATVTGGGGTNDQLLFSNASSGVTVNLGPQSFSGGSRSGSFTGIESVVGSAHDDVFNGSPDPDTASGAGGADQLLGAGGIDVLHGDDGADLLRGGANNDQEFGDAGADTFDQGSAPNGADEINGGADTDTVDYSARSGAPSVSLDGDPNDGEPSEGDNVHPSTENATFPAALMQLDVTKSGTGTGTVTSDPAGVDCGLDCANGYLSGTQVTLTAAPDAGSGFAGWSGACSNAAGDCVVTMSQARTVNAEFTQQTFRSDALIKLSGNNSYIGNGIYNTTGASQTKSTAIKRGRSKTFFLSFQNDGNGVDTLGITGAGTGSGFTVKYLSGTTNVTSAVVKGLFNFNNLGPGASRVMKMVVTVGRRTPLGRTRKMLVTATSAGGAMKDAVAAKAKATARS
jgi:Ca2+-binding RTX toxin-like protein